MRSPRDRWLVRALVAATVVLGALPLVSWYRSTHRDECDVLFEKSAPGAAWVPVSARCLSPSDGDTRAACVIDAICRDDLAKDKARATLRAE